jgi:hypothetical protein
MATTTITYKLYTYPEQYMPGLSCQCNTETFSTLLEAQKAGRAANTTFYEIQMISKTEEPPTKKMPHGSVSTSTAIVERRVLRASQWSQPAPTGLRIQNGINGYFTLKLSDADTLRAAIALRGLGLGLCWRPGRQMVVANGSKIDKIQKVLVSYRLCR